MDYKGDIKNATQKTQLSYGQLKDTISTLYGEENLESIIRSLLGDSATLAYAITICPNSSKVLRWYYDVNKGVGYICEK
jgi:hypothetical protein